MKRLLFFFFAITSSLIVLAQNAGDSTGVIYGDLNLNRGRMYLDRINDEGPTDTLQESSLHEDSSYALTRLPQGRFRLYHVPDLMDKYPEYWSDVLPVTYYPGTIHSDSAQIIEMQKGDTIRLDWDISKAPIYSGPVEDMYIAPSDIRIVLLDGLSPEYAPLGVYVSMDQAFEDEGVEQTNLLYYFYPDTQSNLNLSINPPGPFILIKSFLPNIENDEFLINLNDSTNGDDIGFSDTWLKGTITLSRSMIEFDLNIVDEPLGLRSASDLIYPNPAIDFIKASSDNIELVFDVTGKQYEIDTIDSETLNISLLPAGVGVYFIKMKGQKQSLKFIKL